MPDQDKDRVKKPEWYASLAIASIAMLTVSVCPGLSVRSLAPCRTHSYQSLSLSTVLGMVKLSHTI